VELEGGEGEGGHPGRRVGQSEEARVAFVQQHGTAGVEALVARGGRALDRWLRELRALATAREYREVTIDTERLWLVVGDVTAPAEARAGAAVALSPVLDADLRRQLRITSDTCAEPKLRVALRKVAEGAEERDVDEAVAALVQDKVRT